jgi:hypothetical protein
MTTIRLIIKTKQKIRKAKELKDWTFVEFEEAYLKMLRDKLYDEKGYRSERFIINLPTM